MPFPGHPEIYPVVLTTKTQEIFNCRIDEDITDEQPYKLIKKADILEDFQNRAAVSDFYPVKKVIQVSTTYLFIFWSYLKMFLVHKSKSWRGCEFKSGISHYFEQMLAYPPLLWNPT